MNSLLVYTHPACLRHAPGAAHPEHAGRLAAVIDALRSAFADQLDWIEAPAATDEQLARAHSRRLIAELRERSPSSGLCRLDEDTVMSPDSLDAGLRAAGIQRVHRCGHDRASAPRLLCRATAGPSQPE